jgi:hypothetical protein
MPEVAPMTEAEWLACEHPEPMLQFLRGKVSDRKLRLFVCAFFRLLNWVPPHNDVSWIMGLGVAENYAAGRTNVEELGSAGRSLLHNEGLLGEVARSALYRTEEPSSEMGTLSEMIARQAGSYARQAVCEMFQTTNSRHYTNDDGLVENLGCAVWEHVPPFLSKLLRCIVGNPFRPVTADPAWLTPTVVALAESVWEDYYPDGLYFPALSRFPALRREVDVTVGHQFLERGLEGLPILADALEDAGCTNQDILNHCRQGRDHVRGCWVVDLLLAKE